MAFILQAFQFFHHAVDGMIVVRGKQNGPLVKKRRGHSVYDGICLAGTRRPLHIGNRIPHRIVDGEHLIQIDLVVEQRQRKGFSSAGPRHHLTKKRLDRGRHFLPLWCIKHPGNSAVLVFQVHQNFPSNGHKIGHIIHTLNPAAGLGHAILDLFCVLFKFIQQLIVLCVQESVCTYFYPIQRELPADYNLVHRTQCMIFNIQS